MGTGRTILSCVQYGDHRRGASRHVTATTRSVRLMGRRIDIDDLRNAEQVAEMLGLSRPQAVHQYRRDYPDFPTPVYSGRKTVLWVWQDIEAWRAKHPPRRRNEP